MAIVRPFRALRPAPELAEKVVSPPYDVVNRKMARDLAEGNPYSFLHVCRAEIDLPPETDPYSDEVYRKAKENIARLTEQGVLIQESRPMLYIYRQEMQNRSQTGIVAGVSVDDYMNNVIKKHELTLAAKEADRIRHFDICSAHTEPVFLVHRRIEELEALVKDWTEDHAPAFSCTDKDQVTHTLWPVDDQKTLERISALFDRAGDLYIADGHHRSASSAKVGLKRRESHPQWTGQEEFNFFMAVILPESDILICDYSRLIKDLNGLTEDEFLDKLSEFYTVEPWTGGAYKPEAKHSMGLCLKGGWYKLKAKDAILSDDVIEDLDVSILQKNVLAPILGIEDPRTDSRISFVGGLDSLRILEEQVAGGVAAALALYPVSMEEIMAVADQGRIMPPKSTWFEPKLGSGLFLHQFEE